MMTEAALKLLMDGSLAMARITVNGLHVDVPRLERSIQDVKTKIHNLETKIRSSKEHKIWQKRFGNRMVLGSRQQLGTVIFGELGHSRNKHMNGRNDISSFEHIDLPFVQDYFTCERLKKALSTYLYGLQREVVDGYVHPFFSLNTVSSYRSCVAKGTLIEVVRDVSKYPKGLPIEEVSVGDFVYCYDENKKLTIKKVLWAGKTGKRTVVRVHWSARGKTGYLDVTPEHKIRLVDGTYVAAKHLMTKGKGTARFALVHALAMGRVRDRIWETGNKKELLDHRLVFKSLIGELSDNEVVHHKDGNHLNNQPINLQKMSLSEHTKHHVKENLTPEARKKGRAKLNEMLKNGLIKMPRGEFNCNWMTVSRFGFLRLLAKAKGRLTYIPHDFDTMKRKAKWLKIDLRKAMKRYGGDGRYISIGRLIHARSLTQRKAMNQLKVNSYTIHSLCEERGLIVHNHRITKVEWIGKLVDVYDIEVEDSHNFIANEICVHNSSQHPNLHNQPVRNKEISEIIRSCIIPRKKNNVLLEADYSAQEVRIAAVYCQDPKLISYILGGGDMHKDRAMEIFQLTEEELGSTEGKSYGKTVRYAAKNKFVFPQFYGSYFAQCAPDLWESIHLLDLRRSDGVSLYEHLKTKGITRLGSCDPEKEPKPGTFELHIKNVEDHMWKQVFTVYDTWKKRLWDGYQLKAYVDSLTGFRYQGYLRRNQVLSLGIQGSAFHCLLWSIIQIQKEFRKRKLKALVICQIHDSMLIDCPQSELTEVAQLVKDFSIHCVVKHWPWINVPLAIEFELAEDNWFNKKPYHLGDNA